MVQGKNKNNRAGKKVSRPARNVNLVVTAMRNLGNANGSTVGNIVEYITEIAEKPASKREILMTLKRGVEFGLMDQKRGRYFFLEDEKRNLRQTETRSYGVRKESSQLLEHSLRIQSRNPDRRNEARENKSKDTPRRRKKKKSSKKSTGRKPVKKTRFARSLKSNNLSDYYENPSFKASAVSSIDSLDYWQGEKRRYWK